jgi:hypothetical protein
MLLPDLHVTVPCGKISSMLLCAIASIRSSASVCCVGSRYDILMHSLIELAPCSLKDLVKMQAAATSSSDEPVSVTLLRWLRGRSAPG